MNENGSFWLWFRLSVPIAEILAVVFAVASGPSLLYRAWREDFSSVARFYPWLWGEFAQPNVYSLFCGTLYCHHGMMHACHRVVISDNIHSPPSLPPSLLSVGRWMPFPSLSLSLARAHTCPCIPARSGFAQKWHSSIWTAARRCHVKLASAATGGGWYSGI